MTRPDRTVVILQARMGSRRLPGKVLEPLARRPVVVHCLERLLVADVGPVVLATTTLAQDDVLARVADSLRVPVVRGAADDVLERFVAALEIYPGRVAVRATADNPAVDIAAPRRVQRWLDAGDADYVVEAGLPYGAAVEAVRTEALLEAHRTTRDPVDREHVTPWILRQTRFRVLRVPAPSGLRRPDLRFTVDTPADLRYMRSVMARAGASRQPVPLERLIEAAGHTRATAEVA